MKKVLIIGVVLLFVVALVYKPIMGLFQKEHTNPVEIMVNKTILTDKNIASVYGKKISLNFEVFDELSTLNLTFNDSLIKSWKNPKGKLSCQFELKNFGVGTGNLKLISTYTDGHTFEDERLLRIVSDIDPEIWIAKVIKSYPHNTTSFTQGLEFSKGVLFESTGQKGQSLIAKVDLNSGEHLQKIGLDGTYFGEGITLLNGKIYQLTWQEQKCFVYDESSMQIEKDFAYNGEGWGLCNDGTYLIMSNGTERIEFRDPKTFQVVRTIEVYTNQQAIPNINELEYIEGKIYANIWMTNSIMVIDPKTGRVEAVINANEPFVIGKGNGDVLNGIAYNKSDKKIYLTGKNWPKLMEVTFQKPKDL